MPSLYLTLKYNTAFLNLSISVICCHSVGLNMSFNSIETIEILKFTENINSMLSRFYDVRNENIFC